MKITNVWNENQHGECKLSTNEHYQMKINNSMWKMWLAVNGVEEWFI
jgi:hypothetical protein